MSSHSPEFNTANLPRSLISNPEPTPDSNTTLDQRSRSYHQAITAMYHPFNQSLCEESKVSGLIRMSSKHLRHSILHGVKPHNGLVLCCPLENGLITSLFLILPVIARFLRLGTGFMLSRCDVDSLDLTYFETSKFCQTLLCVGKGLMQTLGRGLEQHILADELCWYGLLLTCILMTNEHDDIASGTQSKTYTNTGHRQQQASHESRWPVF
ncbi:hypothetical protein E4T43_09233 [Aureobasidium subglaciale]|nr:hypothetical protein E4T43_09233 [Aureobasidium subglaciale]